jgi:hypothetical protein
MFPVGKKFEPNKMKNHSQCACGLGFRSLVLFYGQQK